tara:strand:+ start:235 stop:426 length:192 start_codon:yes stop_codon:yes gene_type:complete
MPLKQIKLKNMNLELIKNLKEIEKGLFKLSLDRKVVLPHHKTFELVDEMRNTVKKSLELIEND